MLGKENNIGLGVKVLPMNRLLSGIVSYTAVVDQVRNLYILAQPKNVFVIMHGRKVVVNWFLRDRKFFPF